MKKVVLQWPSFGPYHTARLAACRDHAPHGVEVVGLAVAGQVDGLPWLSDEATVDLRIVTLFPHAMYHQLGKKEVAAGMKRGLDNLSPCAVGVSGYGMTDSRAALRWCVKNRVNRVLMSESKADDAPRVWWKEHAKRRLVARFNSGLCGGSPHRDYLRQLGMPEDRIFDKYDVVDNCRFKLAADAVRRNPENFRKLEGLEDCRPFFLVCSRFVSRKNIAGLLDAYKQFRQSRSFGWRLVVLGTGPDEAELQRMVVDESIPDVTFAGFKQFDELVAYYALAGALIHPALQEQWGLVVNEAMACGLPVLVSRTVGAAYDLVEDGGNGFRFDPQDRHSICSAMEKIFDDPQLRKLMASRSLEIIADWTPEHFAMNFWSAVQIASSNDAFK